VTGSVAVLLGLFSYSVSIKNVVVIILFHLGKEDALTCGDIYSRPAGTYSNHVESVE